MFSPLLSLLTALAGSPCPSVPLYRDGQVSSYLCEEVAARAGLTIIDLSSEWTPRLFSEEADLPQPYRAIFVALANERPGVGKDWDAARQDRYYELFGISPTFAIIRARLADDARHACHDAAAGASTGAIPVLQSHLRCDGLLPASARPGALDPATARALALFQRKHMLPSRPVLDAETREALGAGSRELDFRTLLRALRERVVDATGLIEDGSAANAWMPVLGRQIDSAEYRTALRREPMPRAAPDLIAGATEAAARALGWTSPQAARLAGVLPGKVAVRLPPAPPYHARRMALRAEIDRGDVWADYPLDAAGRPRPSPARRRPTLVIYAQTNDGEVALVRWPTTIGSWKDERIDEHSVAPQYKPSPTGRRLWRDLLSGPAWFPPPTTPDRELVRWRPETGWTPDQDAVGPGYRSAYGLVALLHHRPLQGNDTAVMADEQIRTHGSGNYRSILRGSSHGCHRLFNHLAIRLGSFLLAHREYVRHGAITERYTRSILWKGRRLVVRAEGRGYRYELVPPVVVDVLPGRRVHSPVPEGQEVSLAGR